MMMLKMSSIAVFGLSLAPFKNIFGYISVTKNCAFRHGHQNQWRRYSSINVGSNSAFSIVKIYKTDQHTEFDIEKIKNINSIDISRLELTSKNISVPVALMMLDPDEYSTRSHARKACRKANIIIHRGPLSDDNDDKTKEEEEEDLDLVNIEDNEWIRCRTGDRIFPGDVLAKQVRMGDGKFPSMRHPRPPFDLPVIFEDDHFAIVDKPAGIVVYANRGGGHGMMTVRAAITFAVKPSRPGTYSILRRPQPVHRLDKATSGLLLIAKTKPSMINLSYQFRDRKIKKTYTAIVNGIPPPGDAISAVEAHRLGVDVDPGVNGKDEWQIIDHALDEKSAVTVWKVIKSSKSIHARDNVLTSIELKPKTGRFHQLRRHMSWVLDCPIAGDDKYDGGGDAMRLRGEGLHLCSNKVTLEHPSYNDMEEEGIAIFQQLSEKEKEGLWMSPEGKVMVTACIDIPDKFESFISEENNGYIKQTSEEV